MNTKLPMILATMLSVLAVPASLAAGAETKEAPAAPVEKAHHEHAHKHGHGHGHGHAHKHAHKHGHGHKHRHKHYRDEGGADAPYPAGDTRNAWDYWNKGSKGSSGCSGS